MKKNKIKKILKTSLLSFLIFIFLFSSSGLSYLRPFSNKKNVALAGIVGGPLLPETSTEIQVRIGWTMISTGGVETTFTDLKNQNSDCRFKSGPWKWTERGYKKAEKLEPLKGYWVYSEKSCTAEFSGNPGAGTLQLHSDWNVISSTTEKSFNELNVDCDLVYDKVYTWNPAQAQYEVLSLDEKLNPTKGYWVKTKGLCSIQDKGVSALSVCFEKQGPPVYVCEPAQILNKGTSNEVCRHAKPVCDESSQKWNCNYQEEIKPCAEAQCKETGWDKIFCEEDYLRSLEKEKVKPELAYLLCKFLTGGIDLSLVGEIGIPSPEDILSSVNFEKILGTDIAAKIKATVEFITWLKKQGINVQDIAQNPAQLNLWIDAFLKAGSAYVSDIAATEIKKFITYVMQNLQIDPQLAAVMGDFISFLLKTKKFDLEAIFSMNVDQFRVLLMEFITSTKSPIMQYILQLEKVIRGLTTIPRLVTDTALFKNVSGLIDYIQKNYHLTPEQIADLQNRDLEKYLQEYNQRLIAEGKKAIKIEINDLKKQIRDIVDNVINGVQGFADSKLLTDILGFIDYLQKNGIDLNDVLNWSEAQFAIYYKKYKPGAVIAGYIGQIRTWTISMIEEMLAPFQLKITTAINISDQAFGNVMSFVDYLTNNGLSLDQIINLSEVDLSSWKEKFQKSGGHLEIGVGDLSSYLISIIREMYGQAASQTSQYNLSWKDFQVIIDFVNWLIADQGKTFYDILNSAPGVLASLFNQFQASIGSSVALTQQRLSNIVNNVVSSFVTQISTSTPVKTYQVTVDFINWLMEEKNYDFEKILNAEADELKNLFEEYKIWAGVTYNIKAEKLKGYVNRLVERIKEETTAVADLVKEASDIIDFIKLMSGMTPEQILALGQGALQKYIESYLDDPARSAELIAFVFTQLKGYLQATFNIDINKGILKDVMDFIIWLNQVRDLSLQDILDMAVDDLMNLATNYVEYQITKVTNIKPQDIRLFVAILAMVPDLPKIIEEISKMDLKAIVSRFLEVKVSGNLSCPLLQGDVCAPFKLSDWRKPKAGDLELGDVNPNDFKVTVKYGYNSRPGQFKICDAPGVSIKFLGSPITYDFRIGPLELDGSKLYIDVPTQCSFDAGTAHSKRILLSVPSEQMKKGFPYIYHTIYGGKTMIAQTKCSVWGENVISDLMGLTDKKQFIFTLNGKSPPYQVKSNPPSPSAPTPTRLHYFEKTFEMKRAGKLDYMLYNNGLLTQYCTWVKSKGFTSGYVLKKNGKTVKKKEAHFDKKPYWPVSFPTMAGTLSVAPGDKITIGGWGCTVAPAGGTIQFKE